MPPFASGVNVTAKDENEAELKAVKKIIKSHPVYKRRTDKKYWTFETKLLSEDKKSS